LVGEASLLAVTAYFVLALAGAENLQKSDVPRSLQAVAVLLTVLLPVCAAGWLLFRRLDRQYEKGNAKAIAITFCVFTPLSLSIAILLASITGGYLGFLGRPFGLVGAFAGMVVITTLSSFMACMIAVWIIRRRE